MHFTENDAQFQAYLDGALPPDETRAIEEHLTACPDCRALVQHWQELDTALSQTFSRPALSPDFRRRLRTRIAASAPEDSAFEEEHGLDLDFERTWSRLRQQFFHARLPAFLDALGYITAAAVGGYLLFPLLLRWLSSHAKSWQIPPTQLALMAGTAAGVLFLLVAFGLVSRKHITRWVEELA